MKLFWPVALMVVIFCLSSIPGVPRDGQFRVMTDLDPTVQNFLHIPLFGLLQWFWLKGLTTPGRSLGVVIGLATFITFAYASLDELHQAMVPGRYASVQDIFLDAVGVVLGTLFFLFISMRSDRFRVRRRS